MMSDLTWQVSRYTPVHAAYGWPPQKGGSSSCLQHRLTILIPVVPITHNIYVGCFFSCSSPVTCCMFTIARPATMTVALCSNCWRKLRNNSTFIDFLHIIIICYLDTSKATILVVSITYGEQHNYRIFAKTACKTACKNTKTALNRRFRVVDRGIEPLCQDWESCILTIRWIDLLLSQRNPTGCGRRGIRTPGTGTRTAV